MYFRILLPFPHIEVAELPVLVIKSDSHLVTKEVPHTILYVVSESSEHSISGSLLWRNIT
jgi:hypothetical protein